VGRTRTAALAAAVYGAGLAYLSLARGGQWACGGAWLAEQAAGARVSRADLLVNFVAYLPFGLMLAAACDAARRLRAVAVATMLGAALSLSVELLQACLAARTSSLLDLASNAAGAFVGAAALLVPWRLPALLASRRAATRPLLAGQPLRTLAAITLLAWFAGRTFPWVLTADVGQIRQNLAFVRPVLAGHLPLDAWRLAAHFAQWVLAGLALRALLQPWAPVLRLTVALAALVLALQSVLAVRTLSLEQLIALPPALALLALLRLPAITPALPPLLAAAALSMATVYQLRPGRGPPSGSFSWWPVFGLGSALGALQLGLFFFTFAFACALALAWRFALRTRRAPGGRGAPASAALPTTGATVAAAGLSIAWLAALEFAQLWVPGRTADTSTPLLALVGWAVALAALSRITDPAPPRGGRSAR